MKTQLTLTRFMIVSSFALGLPVAAMASPVMDGHDGCRAPMQIRSGRDLPPFLHGMDLSETQRDRIFELMHAQAPAMRKQAKAVRESQDELRQLGLSKEYSESRAALLAEINAQAMAKMSQLLALTDHKIYQTLTLEQRKQLDQQKAFPQNSSQHSNEENK